MNKEFSARRLTIARQRRSMTKKSLAQEISVSAQAITDYESGACAPIEANVQRIADVLRFPVSFFLADDIDATPLEAISFRSRRAMTATVRDKIQACGDIASGLVAPALLDRFDLPEQDIPDLSGEDAEESARILRSYWRLGQGPISNMVHLLEAHGVFVFWTDEPSPSVDAVSFWRDGTPFILMSFRSPAGERGRFDTAHELAHLVLHRRVETLDTFQVESEADRFASAFLLPEEQYRAESPRYPVLNQFLELKPRWKVSMQAMIRRSRDLGLLSPWQYQAAFKELSIKGWRKNEPMRVERETSALLEQTFERLALKGVYPENFAQEVHLEIDILSDLVPEVNVHRQVTLADLEAQYATLEGLGYVRDEDLSGGVNHLE